MKMRTLTFAAVCLAGAIAASSAQATQDDQSGLIALVQRHAQAQNSFDQAALRATTAENYVEISPVGEVDSREKMLSFYAPEQKRPSPQLKVDEPAVRVLGDTAIISVRLNYTLDQEGTPRSFAMRGGYVARLVNNQWLLVSAQYTGIRPPKK